MGRQITLENFVQETLNTITKNKTIHTGLIIGQVNYKLYENNLIFLINYCLI